MTLKNYKQNFCCGINKKFNLIEKIPNISSIFYKKEGIYFNSKFKKSKKKKF